MKQLFLLVFLIIIASAFNGCGDTIYAVKDRTGLLGGYYNLDGPANNCVYIDEQVRKTVYALTAECQSLVTVNPANQSLGQFPRLVFNNLVASDDGALRASRNLNFTSGHDLEEDVSGRDVRGVKRVDIVLKLINNKLIMQIKVFKNANNDNLNEVIIDREFKEI